MREGEEERSRPYKRFRFTFHAKHTTALMQELYGRAWRMAFWADTYWQVPLF